MENETAIKAAKSIASAVSGFDIEDTSVKKETGTDIKNKLKGAIKNVKQQVEKNPAGFTLQNM